MKNGSFNAMDTQTNQDSESAHSGHHATAALREVTSGLMEGIENFGRKTKEFGEEKIMAAEMEVTDYLQKHPIRTLAAAVCTGVVIGWLGKRK